MPAAEAGISADTTRLGAAARLDRINAAVGRAVPWLALLMVLVGAFNTIVRYLGPRIGIQLSSNAYLELQWYLFSLLFLLGGAWTLQRDRHVRVDVLYSHRSDRARAWIDAIGTALLLIPFTLAGLWVAWGPIKASWAIREGSPDPGGLPRYPIKTVIVLGFALLLIQAVANLIHHIRVLRGREESPPPPSHGAAVEGA
ncbi:MAG: TRAP transporter small permease subunit [Gemmatimonadales bacterium]